MNHQTRSANNRKDNVPYDNPTDLTTKTSLKSTRQANPLSTKTHSKNQVQPTFNEP